MAQRQLFGHQFADDEGNIGDGHDDQAHAQRVGEIVGDARAFEDKRQPLAESGAGKRAG